MCEHALVKHTMEQSTWYLPDRVLGMALGVLGILVWYDFNSICERPLAKHTMEQSTWHAGQSTWYIPVYFEQYTWHEVLVYYSRCTRV